MCCLPGVQVGTGEESWSTTRVVLCIPLQCQPTGLSVGMETGTFYSGSGMRCRIPHLSVKMLWKAGESKVQLLRSSLVILSREAPRDPPQVCRRVVGRWERNAR